MAKHKNFTPSSLNKTLYYTAKRIPGSRVALFLGIMLICFYIISTILITGTYIGMAQREANRISINIKTTCAEKTVTYLTDPHQSLYLTTCSALYKDAHTQGLMVYVKDKAKAPLHPGVTNYPDPGQVLVSPAIAKHNPIGSLTPWGRIAGILPISALSTPTEKYFIASVK